MSRREILGYAAAACVACCIGPILGVLAAIAALGLASTILIGAAGLVIAAAAITVFVLMRRKRTSVCSSAAEQVPVELTEADAHLSDWMPTMNPIAIYDATAPIACSIGTDEIPERIELVERLRTNVRDVERTSDGLLLRFAATAANENDVRRLANDEKRCCPFWGFAVDTEDDELTLRWDGPPAAVEIVDRLYDYLTGTATMDALTGLLARVADVEDLALRHSGASNTRVR